MITAQQAISRRQLEERIAYLQVTLAALTAQLESQRHLDNTVETTEVHTSLETDIQPDPVDTPLPVAAG